MPGSGSPEVPSWVVRMREAGFDVRIGTGTEGLSEIPEVAFTLPPTRHAALRRRVKALARKLWQRGHSTLPTGQSSAIHSGPEIMGGTPVFVGTRVPLKNLIDYLEGGHSLDDFLDDFPSVIREQAVTVLGELPRATGRIDL